MRPSETSELERAKDLDELAADVEDFLARDLRTVMLTANPLAIARFMATLQSVGAGIPPARRAQLEALLSKLNELHTPLA